VVLRDAHLRSHPLQGPVRAVPLRLLLQRRRHRAAAGLQPGCPDLGINRVMWEIHGQGGGRNRLQPRGAQEEAEARKSDHL